MFLGWFIDYFARPSYQICVWNVKSLDSTGGLGLVLCIFGEGQEVGKIVKKKTEITWKIK